MLTPSGTDAEILVTLLALARHQGYTERTLEAAKAVGMNV